MFCHRLAVLLLVCSLLAVASVASAARPYYLTDLGNLFGSGAGTCDAQAISTVGGQLEIVGNSQGTDLAVHPWYWTQATGMINLDSKLNSDLGATSAQTTGVNSSGQIAGVYNGNYGYVYTIGGTATQIDLSSMTPPGWSFLNVGNINDSGQVTGSCSVSIDPTSRPVICNVNSGVVTNPGSGANITARVINNNGWVAGSAGGPSTAHVWNGTSWVDLGVPSSSYTKGSVPLAINTGGDVAGLVGFDTATQGHACYVPYNGSSWGTMVDLGNLTSYDSAYVHARAQGINDSRQIVGYAWPSIRQYSTEYAFVAGTTAGSAVALNTLISADNQSNWRLCTAFAIDNAGNIVGGGLKNGIAEAYLLKPAMMGDTDLDGTVNITDLSKVLTNYDKAGLTWADGDFDGNGTVNINDLSNVLTNYDKSASTAAGIEAVPEPSALVLAAIGLMGLVACAWRRRT